MRRVGLGRPSAAGPRLTAPVTVTGSTMTGDHPVQVGGWQQTNDPVHLPVDGGTRPVFQGHGTPPDFIPGARVSDYYLDLDSGLLYRLGGAP